MCYEDPNESDRQMKYAGLCVLIGVIVIVLSGLLSGCSPARSDPPPPVAAQCNAICHVPCVGEDGDTGIRWDGTPQDPAMFDILVEDVALPLAEKLRVCETRRKACDQCLQRLKDQGVIL